jgi:hypothetical protein
MYTYGPRYIWKKNNNNIINMLQDCLGLPISEALPHTSTGLRFNEHQRASTAEAFPLIGPWRPCCVSCMTPATGQSLSCLLSPMPICTCHYAMASVAYASPRRMESKAKSCTSPLPRSPYEPCARAQPCCGPLMAPTTSHVRPPGRRLWRQPQVSGPTRQPACTSRPGYRHSRCCPKHIPRPPSPCSGRLTGALDPSPVITQAKHT